MSLKRGLIDIKSRLYPSFSLGSKVNLNCHQEIKPTFCRLLSVTKRVKVKKGNSRSITELNKTVIDSGQRYFHVLSKRYNERVTALNDIEPEEHESPIIEPPVSHDDVVSRLKQCSTVAEQMLTLKSTLSLSEKDRNERFVFCNDIQNMLAPFFDDFKIHLYGSSVNGFGFKGCDMDMSFRTNVDLENVMKAAIDDSRIPTIEAVLSGKTSPQYMSKLSPTDQLLFIHTVFLDYYKSAVVPMFIKAYIPLVRFTFDKYSLKCDLTSANKVALHNTKLLYLFGSLDHRVYPLAMTLRYWAKHVGLIGGGLMFNTYTVTLMVMFFLQTRTPPVLPPAELLLNLSGLMNSDDINHSKLSEVLEKIPKSKNTETLEELFREFFFYYLYFDFTRVICPITATAVPRDIFCIGDVHKKFRLNTICVQDPAKLTHNVANLVDYKHCRKFAVEMVAACKLLQSENFWIPKSEDWGLTALFNREETTTAIWGGNFTIDVPLSSFPKSSQSDIQCASNLIQKILHYVLLFRCEDCLQGQGLNNYSDERQALFWLKCMGHNNTWLGRNCAKLEDFTSSDFLERERLISLSLCDRVKEEKKRDFSFLCKGYVIQKDKQSYLHLKLMPFGKTEFSSVLGIFLKEYIPKTIKSVL